MLTVNGIAVYVM